MGWAYTLIDGWWDKKIGYERLEELVRYARAKNVSILVWYNSAGSWNSTPQTPRDRLLTRAGRVEEFARLQRIGVAGLKVDFFGGDGQSMIEYYQDILEDAAGGVGDGAAITDGDDVNLSFKQLQLQPESARPCRVAR